MCRFKRKIKKKVIGKINFFAGGVRIEKHIRNKKEKEKFTEQYEKCMSDTSSYKMRCANLKQRLRKKLLEKKN